MPEETTKEHSLNDFSPENLPKNEKDMEDFMKDHASDKYSAEEVTEKFGSKFGEISGNVIGFILALMMTQAARYTGKLIEYVKLHRLNDEALPKIQFKKNKLEENIAKKWEELKKLHPEIESFQTQAKAETKTESEAKDRTKKNFKEWASKISPEEKKRLKEEYRITPENAYAYKKIYDRRQNSIAQKDPNPILKIPTPSFHPKLTTSAVTKQGKTDQEYEKQFNEQSPPVRKSILRNDRKRLKKREKKKGIAKKPTGYREKFKRMYSYLFDDNSNKPNPKLNTPIKNAAADVASQEYNKSKKKEEKGNYNPAETAVAAAELAILTEEETPPPYEPPPTYEESTTTEETPPNYDNSSTPSTHSPSSLKQQLRSLQGQNQNNNTSQNHQNSSKYRKAAKKLRKKGKHKISKKALKAKKKVWYKRMNPRCCGIYGCLAIIILIFIAVIIVAVTALVLALIG